MKKLALLLLCSIQAAHAQDTAPINPGVVSSRAVNAPCWIPLGKGVIVDAGRILSFRKLNDTNGTVYVDVSGATYQTQIQTGSPALEDQFINHMRLLIAACFGDTTEGQGVGLGK